MSNLQLSGVSKIYPSGVLAIYKVSLQLSDGEFIAIVGGEKCGKSTLLRMIAGLEEVTEGQISVGDKDVTALPSAERDLAMIFQGNTLYPSLNVYDNMAYGLRVRKASSTLIEQRVKAAAEILGLSDLLYRKPKTLTAEQKQKAAFGRAIAREPKLYLLDDPLSGIDAKARENLRSALINLQVRMNGTFIYATKNVNDALTMATRIIVLRDGFLQQIDTPANLYEYPANAYVAFTVGSPTVNFLNNSKIIKEGGEVSAVADGVKFPLPQNIVSRFERLEEYANTDKKVILGVRPEDITLCGDGGIASTVAAAETVCGVPYAECDFGKLSVTVRAQSGSGEDVSVSKGDRVMLCPDLTHAFIFDADTRLTLLNRDEGYIKTEYPDADFVPLAYAEEEQLKKKFSLSQVAQKKKK